MNKYQSLPSQLVAGWADEDVTEKRGEVTVHYHKLEEWLKVLKGNLTFYSAGNRNKYPLGEGQVLHIPQGEVHRVEVGEGGATYRMWTPVPATDPFRLGLDDDLQQLIDRNLQVPEYENRWDRRDMTAPRDRLEQSDEYKFLDGFVSKDLTFRTAPGTLLHKDEYLSRPPAVNLWRFSSGSVCILHLAPAGVLLSTVVHTRTGADPRQSAVNVRSFVKESGAWVCRLWLNYLEPQVGSMA